MFYNRAQSFFIDSSAALDSQTVYVTSIELYFKNKPNIDQSITGVSKPGISINLCPVVDGKPQIQLCKPKTIARVEYDNINISTNASTSTKFTFKVPALITTNTPYAFVISFDNNEQFLLWKNKSGEADIISGAITKNSSGKVDGNYYEITSGSVITPLTDVDLKFKLNVAKFVENTSNSFIITNDSYEFLKLSAGSLYGNFIGGEYVYRQQSNATGTVTVSSGGSNVVGTSTDFGNTTGSWYQKISNNDLIIIANNTVSQVRKVNIVTNTSFLNVTSSFSTSMTSVSIRTFEKGTITTDSTSNTLIGTNTFFDTILSSGDYIIISDGTDGNTEVRQVVSVSNSSSLILDVVPSFSNSTSGYYLSPVGKVDTFKNYSDYLTLYKSNANSTLYFTSNDIVKGVDSLANASINLVKDVAVNRIAPNFNVITPSATKASYKVNFANSTYQVDNARSVNTLVGEQRILDYSAIIASRSNEVNNSGNLFANAKSMNANVTFSTSNPFVSPYVLEENLDFGIQQFLINNDSTNESYANGAAYSRYVSRPVTLDKDQIAEDLFVYMTAYRPSGTDIEVYSRLLSEEDNENLNQKNWTKMTLDIPTGSSIYSLDSNPKDYVSLIFNIPNYHTGTLITSGSFSTSSACNVLVGSYSTVNTDLISGDLVRVYSPTFPDTYFVEKVVSSNTTTITVSKTVTNSDIISSGLRIEKITDKNSAFLDNQNFNVVRYYNSSNAKYDGFKKFALKIVLKSSTEYKVPVIKEYRAIATSA